MNNKQNHNTADRIISLLYIEDISSEKDSIIQALSQHGVISDLSIKTASNLKDGLEILQKNTIDVVLLDLDLADSKGLQSISTILHTVPNAAIIVLSGHSEEGIITEALMLGAQYFLVKGECSGVMIKTTIYQMLARKKIISMNTNSVPLSKLLPQKVEV